MRGILNAVQLKICIIKHCLIFCNQKLKMGRRSDHTREELQQLIIEATRDLVKEQGVTKVTVRQIAQAVGYTPGMLYSVFDNLQAIFLHVNVVTLDSLYSKCRRAQKKAKNPEGAIRAMGLAYLKFAENRTHEFQLLFQPMPPPDVTRPTQLGTRIQSLFGLVELELKALDPNASESAVALGARTLWSGVHGAAALNLTDQLYSTEKHPDQLVLNMLVSRFVESWQK